MIRRVLLPGTGIEASCLGFGCASLGSRVSAREGLEALARAHEAGVTWFDLAPAYGAGEAEGIFSRFLAGRREQVSILTKVGLAPPRASWLMRTTFAAARPLLAAVRGLRGQARRMRAIRNRALAITPELIERSVAGSLARLGTDRVEVLALHDPDPQAVRNEEILRALERVVARGQARFLGVAGSLEACLAATRPDLPYTVFQTGIRPGSRDFEEIEWRSGREITLIGHSLFGVGGTRDSLMTRLRGDASATDALAAAGYAGADLAADLSALLLDAALAGNRAGVTLVSMFEAAHLAQNSARASGGPRDTGLELLRKLMIEA